MTNEVAARRILLGRSALWAFFGRYLLFVAPASLLWETLHLPLYTLWTEGSIGEKAFAVVHCTAGDMAIASGAFLLAVTVVGRPDFPQHGFGGVALLAVTFGVGYTLFSEWINTTLRQSWSYAELMPVIPVVGTGLSPLAQWLVVPTLGLACARQMQGTTAGDDG